MTGLRCSEDFGPRFKRQGLEWLLGSLAGQFVVTGEKTRLALLFCGVQLQVMPFDINVNSALSPIPNGNTVSSAE
jgi:hypothetical protein